MWWTHFNCEDPPRFPHSSYQLSVLIKKFRLKSFPLTFRFSYLLVSWWWWDLFCKWQWCSIISGLIRSLKHFVGTFNYIWLNLIIFHYLINFPLETIFPEKFFHPWHFSLTYQLLTQILHSGCVLKCDTISLFTAWK